MVYSGGRLWKCRVVHTWSKKRRLKITPTLYGAETSPSPNMPESGITKMGEMNCPRYRAAEISGMTVVAEFLPPLMLAIVFK